MAEPEKRKLVLIAPATETKTAIDNFFKIIPADPTVKAAFEAHIEQLVKQPLSYFSVARVVNTLLTPVLWIHDKEDTICSFKDVEPAILSKPPTTEFFITNGLGHNKIYKEQHVKEQIIKFLGKPI